jgi:hypothetical protein
MHIVTSGYCRAMVGMVGLLLADISVCETVSEGGCHPPEYYAMIRTEVRERIATQLEKVDLREMGWYADVRDKDGVIEVERETWTLVFDKKTAGVKSAIVRGRTLDDGLVLSDVVLVDESGKEYFRSRAADGTLLVKEESRHVYLDGRFTPRTKDGKMFPVTFGIRYDIYKSCGLVAVRMEALEGKARVIKLRVEHTLGKTPEPLRYLQHSNSLLRDGKTYVLGSLDDAELMEYRDGVYYEARFGAAIWSDGTIGLEAIPLPETYLMWPPKGSEVPTAPIPQPGEPPLAAGADVNDPRYSPDRHMIVSVKNKASHLDFVLMDRQKPELLAAGYKNGWTFSLLPFKRLRPRALMISGALYPVSWHPGVPKQFGAKDECEAAVRKAASEGADIFFSFMTHNSGGPDGMLLPDNKNTRWCRMAAELVQRYKCRVTGTFILCTGISVSQMKRDPILTAEEVMRLRKLAGADENAENFQCDTNSPEYRDYILRGAAICAKEIGASAYYFDLAYVFGPLAGGPSQIEGNVHLMEDLHLLLDSYGPNSTVIWHTGGQVTPAESLAAASFPGEPITGAGRRVLTPGQNAIAYNALLIGSNVAPYEMGSAYRTELPEVWKQFLANGAMVAHYEGNRPDSATENNIIRYFFPLKIFGVENSLLHSWKDGDFSNYVTADNPRCRVNAYAKKGETLLTVCLPPLTRGAVKLILNAEQLDLKTAQVLVYNVLEDKVRIVAVNNNKIVIGAVPLTKEPAILYIRQIENPAAPLIFWSDYNLEIVKQIPANGSDVPSNAKRLDVQCRFKVAPAEGGTARFRLYRGEWASVQTAFMVPFRQIDDDPEGRMSVMEVSGPKIECSGDISWLAEGGIMFRNPRPGWR